jgi:hypothetical protein
VIGLLEEGDVGTIESYESAAGKRYRVRYRKPDHSQTRKNGFKTKREAELFLAENEVSMARGQWIDESHARISVGTLAFDWLQHQTHL